MTKKEVERYSFGKNSDENGDFVFYVSMVDAIEQLKKKHELELKEVAKNVRHKACDLLLDTQSIVNDPQYGDIQSKIMNIKFEDVKPSNYGKF
mgnify:CR=1 FL=1